MSEEIGHRDDQLTVTYNGADRHFVYRPQEQVGTLLTQAKKEFNVESQHLLSLFTEGGIELPDGQSLEQAGVQPGAVLVLRQSKVKGGA